MLSIKSSSHRCFFLMVLFFVINLITSVDITHSFAHIHARNQPMLERRTRTEMNRANFACDVQTVSVAILFEQLDHSHTGHKTFVSPFLVFVPVSLTPCSHMVLLTDMDTHMDSYR